MKFKEIKLSEAFVIEIEKKEDDRGFFLHAPGVKMNLRRMG